MNEIDTFSISFSLSSDSAVNSTFSVTNEIQDAAKPIVSSTQTAEDVRNFVSTNEKEKNFLFQTRVSTVEKSEEKAGLINTYKSEQQQQDNIIPILAPQTERKISPWTRSTDPMTKLIEMGFSNRAKNQRLLRENHDDLDKVVELLTLDSAEDPNWFNHRH